MKKGFTLIELLVSISIISLITLFQFKIVAKEMSTYKKFTTATKEDFYFDEAIFIIGYKIKNCAKNISVSNNTVIINETDGKKDVIRFSNNKILIDYYNNMGNKLGVNNLMLNAYGFNPYVKDNVLYIEITLKGGKKLTRCFIIKKQY